jgi:hypothetical protein
MDDAQAQDILRAVAVNYDKSAQRFRTTCGIGRTPRPVKALAWLFAPAVVPHTPSQNGQKLGHGQIESSNA